jgi:hypothetical protein
MNYFAILLTICLLWSHIYSINKKIFKKYILKIEFLKFYIVPHFSDKILLETVENYVLKPKSAI